ncbi:hypothetical protein L9G16_18005 [Shewanella sp. A25]|nr:hypothetical protein [Shewanella shenzhenensis]
MTNKYKETRSRAVQLYLYEDEKEYIKALVDEYNSKYPNSQPMSISSFIYKELKEYSMLKSAQNHNVNELLALSIQTINQLRKQIDEANIAQIFGGYRLEAKDRELLETLIETQRQLESSMSSLAPALFNYKPVAPALGEFLSKHLKEVSQNTPSRYEINYFLDKIEKRCIQWL